jgi:hypothetical protein
MTWCRDAGFDWEKAGEKNQSVTKELFFMKFFSKIKGSPHIYNKGFCKLDYLHDFNIK